MAPRLLDLGRLIAIIVCLEVFLVVPGSAATFHEVPTAFLPRPQEPAATTTTTTTTTTTFQSAYSQEELEALNFFQNNDEHDSEARYAKQYYRERETLIRTESAYLLHLPPADDTVRVGRPFALLPTKTQ